MDGSGLGKQSLAGSSLAGKRVLVTRAVEQAEGLCRALEEARAVPLRCPTIRLTAPASWTEVDAALARLADYDWIVFTSANGVRFTLDRMRQLTGGVGDLGGSRVAVVGERTAGALAERGGEASFVGPSEGSVPLAESLPDMEGAAVLMARSDRADPVAGDVLRRRGAARVDEVVAYRTVPTRPPEGAVLELSRGVDAATFTSPSTVYGFMLLGGDPRRLLLGALVASLGPTTTAAARESGLEVHVEPEERSTRGLVAALADAFARRRG